MLFGELLQSELDRAGITQRKFAVRVGITSTFASQVCRGDRTPPPDDVERWADVLGLRGADRERFLDLAFVAHVPDPLRARALAKLARVATLERDYADLRREITELRDDGDERGKRAPRR